MATQIKKLSGSPVTSALKREMSDGASPSERTLRIAAVSFGRETCGFLEQAEQREWLVTNGIGGFASGTISGNLTRRYHGLLFAALNPPMGRTQMVAKLDEVASYDDADYPLATNRWTSGAVEPKGLAGLGTLSEIFDGDAPFNPRGCIAQAWTVAEVLRSWRASFG